MTSVPPVVQLLFTVQFQPPVRSLSILDWADLRAVFANDLPVYSQVARAGPMPARLDQLVLDPGLGMPRLSMTSADLAQVVMLQDDRISVGWQRTAPLSEEPNYPGFTATLSRLNEVVSTVMKFLSERATEEVKFSVGELSYSDAFITHVDGKNVRRMEDIFTCLKSNENFIFNQFNLTFRKRMALENQDAFEGMLETTIAGFGATPEGSLAANLLTVIRFEFAKGLQDEIARNFEQAHNVAHDVFSTLVKPEASAILETL